MYFFERNRYKIPSTVFFNNLAIVFVDVFFASENILSEFLVWGEVKTYRLIGCSLLSCQPPGFLQKDQGAPTAAHRQKEREERQRQALQRRKERLRRAEERQQMEGDAWQFYFGSSSWVEWFKSCPGLSDIYFYFYEKTSAEEIGPVNHCDSAQLRIDWPDPLLSYLRTFQSFRYQEWKYETPGCFRNMGDGRNMGVAMQYLD